MPRRGEETIDLDTAYHSRVSKVARDVTASEHKKTKSFLEKQEKITSRAMGKEADKLKSQLDRLETEKKSHLNLDSMSRAEMSSASKRRFSVAVDATDDKPQRGETRSRVMDYEQKQARSNRRLSLQPETTAGGTSSHKLSQKNGMLNPVGTSKSKHMAPGLNHRVNSFIAGVPGVPVIHIDDAEDTDEEGEELLTPTTEKKKVKNKKNPMKNSSPSLYDFAIKTVEKMDINAFDVESEQEILKPKRSDRRLSTPSVSDKPKKAQTSPVSPRGMDLSALKQLEKMLKDTQLNRRSSEELHLKPGTSAERAQKRRLQYLDQILHNLRSGKTAPATFDPEDILKCSYLRLTPSNVQTLESAMREAGKEPGVHAHTRAEDIDVWDKKNKKISTTPSSPKSSEKITSSESKPARVPSSRKLDAKHKISSQPGSRRLSLK